MACLIMLLFEDFVHRKRKDYSAHWLEEKEKKRKEREGEGRGEGGDGHNVRRMMG